MALRDVLRRISAQAEGEILGLFDRWQGGGLSESEFVAAAAAVIARANRRAMTNADRAMAIQLSRLLGRDVPPTPTDSIVEQAPRLRDGIRTLLSDRPEIATTAALLVESQRRRMGRMARSEPLMRGQEAVQETLKRERVGWRRAVGGDPCPLCEELDDGEVRPADVDMARHPNCSCVQEPARL